MKILESFVDNIKQKTTNPFFGTLILVWLVRNWELIYSLFNFDSDCTLTDKKQFILNYINAQNHWFELFINITISLGLMILAYFLIVITRVFVNWIDHKIVPELNLKFVSKLVVSNSRFEESEKQRIDNYNELLKEREHLNKLEVKINELKATITKLDLDLASANQAVNSLSTERSVANQKYLDTFDAKLGLEKTVENNSEEIIKLKRKIILIENFSAAKESLYLTEKISPHIFDQYIKLQQTDSAVVFFNYVAHHIINQNDQDAEINPEYIDLFVENNLIYFKEKLEGTELYKMKNFELSDYGKDLIEHKLKIEHSYKTAIQKAAAKATLEKL
jgi:hypothetical protein